MSSDEVTRILAAVSDLKAEVAVIKEKLERALTGPIEATRLRWGARQIIFFILALVVPALTTFLTLKAELSSITHITRDNIHHVLKPSAGNNTTREDK